MTRATARRVRQALITTSTATGLTITGIAAFTDHMAALVAGAALLIGCGIAEAIEEHLSRPRRPQIPLGAPDRDRDETRAYRHHDHNHDHDEQI